MHHPISFGVGSTPLVKSQVGTCSPKVSSLSTRMTITGKPGKKGGKQGRNATMMSFPKMFSSRLALPTLRLDHSGEAAS